MYQTYLKQLRKAASSYDWNECLEAVRNLLSFLSKEEIIDILLSNIAPLEVKLLPHRQTKLQDLLATNDTEKANYLQLVHAQLEPIADQPGVSNLRNALSKLLDLLNKSVSWNEVEYRELSEVLAGILMGQLLYSWGVNHMDLWFRWYRRSTKSNEDAQILALHFWSSPETKQLISKVWIKNANEIQSALTK